MSRPSQLTTAATDVVADDWTELALREGDGLEISLHWSASTDRIRVRVLDGRLEESFDVHVDGSQALNAFYHPFAYASDRGLGLDRDPREAADLQPHN